MGLADRFKEKLDKRDIFNKQIETEKTVERNIKFISKPTMEKEEETSSNITPEKIKKEIVEQPKQILKFENLETEIIAKIRKTPYWEEYSAARQKNMISNYFEAKTKKRNTVITNSEKQEFIKNILALSNNR